MCACIGRVADEAKGVLRGWFACVCVRASVWCVLCGYMSIMSRRGRTSPKLFYITASERRLAHKETESSVCDIARVRARTNALKLSHIKTPTRRIVCALYV